MLGFNLSVGRNRQSFGDADAQAFITATGLTGTTETTAVRRLVSNLKTYGLWSKMKAIYPFVSDTYNLLSYSQDFANGIWTKNLCTINSNVITAPNGTNTGSKLIVDTNTGAHRVVQSYTTNSTTYTFSIYAKASELPAILIYNATNSNGRLFDLSNGTLGSILGSVTNSSITSAGNGWYRCTVTMPCTGASQTWMVYGSQNATSGYFFAGNGTDGVYLWGSQLEENASATTYQPIATTPANRFVSQFKYNLKDPRDLDAAFRLAFNGTWAYSKQGATPNGVNGWAESYLNQSANLNASSVHLSYYSRTNSIVSAFDMAGNSGAPNYYGTQLACYYTALGAISHLSSYPTESAVSTSTTDTQAYYIGSRTNNTTNKIIRNGSVLATNSTTRTATLPSATVKIAFDGGSSYSNRQVAFSTIGDGLTDTEATNLYTSVQQFNQDLSRQVGVPIVSDADAQSFLNAAQITDLTQANAINTLVVGLKNASLWTKMKAIYPFVGGTATSHKWNLKDPRDLDAAYRLAFFGAWTHSSTGALPNGTNAYADSFLTPSSTLGLNSVHLSYYSRTNNSTNGVEMGSIVTAGAGLYMLYSYSGVSYKALNRPQSSGGSVYTPTTGLLIANRPSSTTEKYYHKGNLVDTITVSSTTLPVNKIYLAAYNNGVIANEYSTKQTAFASIGDGLTDSDASTFYTLVQNFQTTLGRQV